MYARNGRDLNRDLSDYLDFGYVIKTPERLILARPIDSSDWKNWKPAKADAWFVQIAVGRGALDWFKQQAPFPLPFAAWFRGLKRPDDRLHIVPFARI